MVLTGFSLMAYEASRLSAKADPWHHFWFCLGVAGAVSGFLCGLLTLGIYEVQRRRAPMHPASPVEEVSTLITPRGRLVREVVREYDPGPGPQSSDSER